MSYARCLLLFFVHCITSSSLCYSLSPCLCQSNFEIDLGYRQDQLSWSIAGGAVERYGELTYFPNILSELQWKNLQIAEVTASGRYVFTNHYFIKFLGDYGLICHGENTDADYNEDDRQGLYSLSKNQANRGYVYDVSLSIGYDFTFANKCFCLIPLIGYASHEQKVHMDHGFQELYLFPDLTPGPTGSFAGLDSTYKALWFGPWLGIDFMWSLNPCSYLFGGAEYHVFRYEGTGDWNLREELSKFNHDAYGQGCIATLGFDYTIWKNCSVGIISHYRYFKTRSGIERIIVDDEFPIELLFNGAEWVSGDISAFVNWSF